MKIKKLITMGLAGIMAVSAISMTALAADENDELLATVPKENGEIVEVYKSDVENGGYTVDCGSYTIIIDDDTIAAAPLNAFSIQSLSTGVFQTSIPSAGSSYLKTVSQTSNWELSFSNDKGITKYTQYRFTPSLSNDKIAYHFTSDQSCGSKAYASVYVATNAYKPVKLYFADGKEHTISVTDMAYGISSYAEVTNTSYSKTLTGTCRVSN